MLKLGVSHQNWDSQNLELQFGLNQVHQNRDHQNLGLRLELWFGTGFVDPGLERELEMERF